MSNKAHFFKQSGNGLTLVASYDFEGNSNDSVNSYNGTDTNISYVSAVDGLAASFNGTSSYIDIADNSDFSFTDGVGNDVAFEIEFDWKCGAIGGNQIFINKRENLSTGSEWQVVLKGSDFTVLLFHPDGTSKIEAELFVSLSVGSWYNVVVSYNGGETHTDLKITVNSVESTISSMTGTYTGMTNTTSETRIGSAGWASGNYTNGLIDNLKIYKSI